MGKSLPLIAPILGRLVRYAPFIDVLFHRADRFPMRRIRPLLCLVGRFYLHFESSPSYARDLSQGLWESPAISVLTVRKIQHTQIGSVPVILSIALPFPRGRSAIFPKRSLKTEQTWVEKVNFWPLHFLRRVSFFSEPRWITHFHISQATQCNAYLTTDTKSDALLCFMRPWTLQGALKKQLMGVVPKLAIYAMKSSSLGIRR
jgi:hypothetical protein